MSTAFAVPASAVPASSTSTTPIPTHTLTIHKVGDDVVADPFTELAVGDTVRYVSDEPGAEVKIVFDGPSPFRPDDKQGTTVFGQVMMTVVRKSTGRNLPRDVFTSRCFLKLKNGKTIGWLKASGYKIAGADLHVGRP